ncbi:aspartate/glutamate racemase family protein [Schinkia sp. CFF1]
MEQQYIHTKIVEELENGIVNNETKKEFLYIINNMINRDHIQGVILGCTELPMLIKKQDLTIHLFNTTEIHVNKIIDIIFNG